MRFEKKFSTLLKLGSTNLRTQRFYVTDIGVPKSLAQGLPSLSTLHSEVNARIDVQI